MINPQWLKLPTSRTNFHGPKDVRAIEVQLYTEHYYGWFVVVVFFFFLFFFFSALMFV